MNGILTTILKITAMKKFLVYLMALVFPASMFVSCNDDPVNNPNDPQNPSNPDSLVVAPVSTPEEQKKVLEQTAIAVMDEVAASNFENVANLAEYLVEEYSEDNYDYSNIEEWAEECYNALARTFIKTEVEEDYYDDGEWSWGWVYIYDHYKVVCAASNFTGKFEAVKDTMGMWQYTEADDLSFHVQDAQGKPCVLRLSTSGQTKLVHLFGEYDWVDDSYGNDVDTSYYDVNDWYVHIPEFLDITLTQDGDELAKVSYEVDLSSIEGDEFDLSKDKLNMKAAIEFNGYSLVVDNCKYAPKNGTAVAANFKKGNNSLLALKASADIDVTNDGFNGSKNNKVEIDVMGVVQVKGVVDSDVYEILQEYDDAMYADSVADFRNHLDRINELVDLNLYYYNSSTPAAKFELRLFESEDVDYEEYWYIEPVIVFNDETSYALGEYFNEEDFEKLLNAIEKLVNDYDDLIEEEYDEDYEDEDYEDDVE